MRGGLRHVLLLGLLGGLVIVDNNGVEGRLHSLSISSDNRQAFHIETFGFQSGGRISLTLKNFDVSPSVEDLGKDFVAGFLARKTQSQSAAESHLLQDTETGRCSLADLESGTILPFLVPNDKEQWSDDVIFAHDFTAEDEGLYDIEFERCNPSDSKYSVTFDLDLSLTNSEGSYLSAGEAPLPIIFLVFAAIMFGMLAYWSVFLLRNRKNVHKIHVIMAALVLVKGLSLLFDSATYHYINIEGSTVGWTLVDDIVKSIKGVLLFGVIVLIGTGWSFMKPFMDKREKRIVCIVIPLQVVANIAMIVVDESSPGSQSFITWGNILVLADIICCCAVLFPIVWSIRRLREAAQSNGKVKVNLMKLQQFQHFYVMVVAYIYFTRIIVYLLMNTLPFKYEYLGSTCRELATVVFYSLTGYYFRPITDNPYLRLKTDDHDGEDGIEMRDHEFGLGDTGPIDTAA
eukprot:g3758.t1